MKNLALVVNTHSSYSDLWDIFFDQLEKYFPEVKTYVFSDKGEFDSKYEVCYYDNEQNFRSQFLSCIGNVDEEYCIFISEDYFLYDRPDENILKRYIKVLDDCPYLSFIKLLKGMSFEEPRFKNYEDLYELSNYLPYFYSQSSSLWRTEHLEVIFLNGPDLHIAGTDETQQFEVAANKVCQDLGMRGLYCYHGEPKRGIYHYDSVVFPHIATAIVKGKWNLSEYKEELQPLLDHYNIDPKDRGIH
tara:strand:+ start:367 stop:1101 length:735 start_codon:yes stop_codon:yes gene_type:complete